MKKIDKSTIKKVLVSSSDFAGDIILITPFFNALKKLLPNAEIYSLTKTYTEPLLKGNPAITGSLIDDIADSKKTDKKSIKAFAEKLKPYNFDTVFFLHDMPENAWLGYYAGIKNRVGDKSVLGHGWLYNKGFYRNRRNITQHIVDVKLEYLSVLTDEKFSPPLCPAFSQADTEFVDQLLLKEGIDPQKPKIAVHVATGSTAKPWPIKNFIELVRILNQKYKDHQIVFTGGKNEKEKLASQNLDHLKIFNLTTKTRTFGQLAALFKKMDLYIGRDTGPMHIAASCKTPIVAIFAERSLKPIQWGPWQTRQHLVKKNYYCPKVCKIGDCPRPCVEDVTVSDVFEVVENMLTKKLYFETPDEIFYHWVNKSISTMIYCKDTDPKTLKKAEKALSILKENNFYVILATRPKHPLIKFAENLGIPVEIVDFSFLPIRRINEIITNHDISIINQIGYGLSDSVWNLIRLVASNNVLLYPYVVKNVPENITSAKELFNHYLKAFGRIFNI